MTHMLLFGISAAMLCDLTSSADTFSTYGKHFILPYLSDENFGADLTVFLYMYSSSNYTISVNMQVMLGSQIGSAYTKDIPPLTMTNMTLIPNASYFGPNMLPRANHIVMKGDSAFGVTVFYLYKNLHLMSSILFPVEKYGKEHTSIVLRETVSLYLSITEYTQTTLLCEDKTSGAEMFPKVGRLSYCNINARPYSGFSLSGSNPIGVLAIQHGRMSTLNQLCQKETDLIFAQDAVMPKDYLGREFLIPFTNLTTSHVVITNYYGGTVVTEYTNVDPYSMSFTMSKSGTTLKELELLSNANQLNLNGTMARRVSSSADIMMIMFLLPQCSGDNKPNVGDLSMTTIAPVDLFYNDYHIGTPNIMNLKHYCMLFVQNITINTLLLNDYPLSNSKYKVKWVEVSGQNQYKYAEVPLTRWYNHFIGDRPFGCYVFGIGENSGYFHLAGITTVSGHRTLLNLRTVNLFSTQGSPVDLWLSQATTPSAPPCVPFLDVQPSDGIDNDCDGKVDEEEADGTDNDGDGQIDEDTKGGSLPWYIFLLVIGMVIVLLLLATTFFIIRKKKIHVDGETSGAKNKTKTRATESENPVSNAKSTKSAASEPSYTTTSAADF